MDETTSVKAGSCLEEKEMKATSVRMEGKGTFTLEE
jgi:hypothetical protein